MTNAQEIFTAIIAAILGIAFPILIQSISLIDEKYGSTRLMKRFKNEFRYHFFINGSLIFMLII
jgi:predicted small secreted protein